MKDEGRITDRYSEGEGEQGVECGKKCPIMRGLFFQLKDVNAIE